MRKLPTCLNTTVLTDGLPSGRVVASCMYFAYGRLLFCAIDRCSRDRQGAAAAVGMLCGVVAIQCCQFGSMPRKWVI
jgi:hypothetical protein